MQSSADAERQTAVTSREVSVAEAASNVEHVPALKTAETPKEVQSSSESFGSILQEPHPTIHPDLTCTAQPTSKLVGVEADLRAVLQASVARGDVSRASVMAAGLGQALEGETNTVPIHFQSVERWVEGATKSALAVWQSLAPAGGCSHASRAPPTVVVEDEVPTVDTSRCLGASQMVAASHALVSTQELDRILNDTISVKQTEVSQSCELAPVEDDSAALLSQETEINVDSCTANHASAPLSSQQVPTLIEKHEDAVAEASEIPTTSAAVITEPISENASVVKSQSRPARLRKGKCDRASVLSQQATNQSSVGRLLGNMVQQKPRPRPSRGERASVIG